MKLARWLLSAGLIAAMSVAGAPWMARAQDQAKQQQATPQQATPKQATPQRERCRDGETDQVAAYTLTKGEALDYQIAASLTGKPGDPKAGLKWMTHRRLGNCIACHEVKAILELANPADVDSLSKYGFHGNIAPPLDGVASRYTEGELRLIVVNAKKAFPDANTIMPAFHVKEGFHRVIKDCQGLAILTAERVEDVVAYLMTLKE